MYEGRGDKISLPFVSNMRILLILVFLLSGCTTIQYYPKGDYEGKTPYLLGSVNPPICSKCRHDAYLFKKDSHGKVICDTCYRKIKN